MPRWASRITLEVVSVRVERLQDISGDAVQREGLWVDPPDYSDPDAPPGQARRDRDEWARGEFRQLWESIHGAGSWAADLWVWVVEFKRVGGEG